MSFPCQPGLIHFETSGSPKVRCWVWPRLTGQLLVTIFPSALPTGPEMSSVTKAGFLPQASKRFSQGHQHQSATAAPAAVSDPFGYTFVDETAGQTEQHNLFCSADGHVHAVWFNFTDGWRHEDRTMLVPGVPPAVGNPMGYSFVNEKTGLTEQHNLFRSADGHIHALWFNFTDGWRHEIRA